MIKVWLFRLAMALCPRVPRRIGIGVAALTGDLAYYLAPGARHTVESNLRVVLGAHASPYQTKDCARGVFRNAAKNYFDLFRVPSLDLSRFRKLVTIRGFENLESAIGEGKGVILVTAHLGNIDICGQEIAFRALKITSPVEPLRPPKLLEMVLRLRQSKGVKFLPVGPGTLKEVVKVLRRGEAVVLACDRDIQKSGLEMPFFGELTLMPQGAANLALRTGATIIPAFSERLPDDTFVIYVEPALEIDRTGEFDIDLRSAMSKIVQTMERHISARPDQWVVFERRWPD